MGQVSMGSRVRVRTAGGRLLDRRACSTVEGGSTFDVVRVCTEEEWEDALRNNREPIGVPWPADALEVIYEGPEPRSA